MPRRHTTTAQIMSLGRYIRGSKLLALAALLFQTMVMSLLGLLKIRPWPRAVRQLLLMARKRGSVNTAGLHVVTVR